MDRTIRAGVVGFGLGGQVFHAPFLKAIDGLELVAILQRQGDTAAKAYPGVSIERSMESLLARQDLELIVISTPPSTHFDLARQALEANKHVVLDKPFVATSDQARQLIELARTKNLVLSVYQNRRWDGDFLTLQQVIASGELGRLVSLDTRFERFHPGVRPKKWQESNLPGNGILLDLGSHLVDQALVQFGTPEAIFADVRYDRDVTDINDAFMIYFFYPRLRVRASATLLACAPGPRFVLNGTMGSYVKYGVDPQEQAMKDGAILGGPHWGEEPKANWGKLTTLQDGKAGERTIPTLPGDYRKYYENVRDAILGLASLAVPAEHGWRIIRLMEIAQQSSQERRAISCEPLNRLP